MAYNDNANFTPRPKIDISSMGITCSECGVAINELPFEPKQREDGTYGKLFCFECNKKRRADSPRGGFGGGRGFGGGGGGRGGDRGGSRGGYGGGRDSRY